MKDKKCIGLVDDDADFLAALARLLRLRGYQVKTWISAIEFLKCPSRLEPDCLIIDMDMPDMSGLELQELLKGEAAAPQILFLTGKGDISMSVRAMQQGAVHFLTKPVTDNQLISALDTALHLAEQENESRAKLALIKSRYDSLTPREKEVMIHLVLGKPNKIIASELGASLQTIKIHRMRVFNKMGVISAAQLVLLLAPIPSDLRSWM